MNNAAAVLDQNGIAITAGDITVYNYDAENREYLSATVEYLAYGVGIPAHSCIDAPPEKRPGFAVCRDTDQNIWKYVPDHRGETVYSTENGNAVQI
ncbi:tail fiber assembly protein, partial [Escherichia coli]|nr:tail fiber assembly protein [Escherichia coli]EFN5150513.1 tail fiber assembly protein [Escherichia coli]